MRRSLKTFTQFVIAAVTCVLILFVFQNCGSYTPDNSVAALDGTTDSCTGYACNQGPQGLLLSMDTPMGYPEVFVTNPLGGIPYTCAGNNSWCFNIAGYCEAAGYQNTIFTVSLDGTPGIPNDTLVPGTCDGNGRFNVLVTLPSTYPFTSTQTLTIRMYGIDSTGNRYSNPTLGNQLSISVVVGSP